MRNIETEKRNVRPSPFTTQHILYIYCATYSQSHAKSKFIILHNTHTHKISIHTISDFVFFFFFSYSRSPYLHMNVVSLDSRNEQNISIYLSIPLSPIDVNRKASNEKNKMKKKTLIKRTKY